MACQTGIRGIQFRIKFLNFSIFVSLSLLSVFSNLILMVLIRGRGIWSD